jgi:hypothetical protein
MRIILETPPDIRQRSSDTCWAAVLEAFCRVTPGRPRLDQDELLRQFGKLSNSPLDRKIPLDGIRRLFSDHRFGIEIEEVSHTYFAKTPAFLFQKLQTGPVIIGYWEPATNGWHLSLIYGMDKTSVFYLNPDMDGGGYLTNDIEYFSSKGNIIIGSRRW